ncbi:MAG: Uma2 family endonuclease [Methylococcales bacterium]|nr:Uma2 family endonuclease [Methylococcales bacterium]
MSDCDEFENNTIDGDDPMGSLNHSRVQANLSGLLRFKCEQNLVVMSELSLDIRQYDLTAYDLGVKGEIKPDVCAYYQCPSIPEGQGDLVKVTQMPDLVIEILSPRQALDYLIRKIHAYFKLGIKSCWLVMPALDEVRVFSQPRCYKNFDLSTDKIIDGVMNIHIPIHAIFVHK